MAFVVNERTGEGFVFRGILLLEVRRNGRHRVTANLYRGKDIPTEQGTSAYITAAVIPETYVLEQHRKVCTLNGCDSDINVEFTFDIMDSDVNRRLFIGLWSQQTGRQECHDFVGGFSFAIREILENDMGGWYYLLPRVVGLRSYVRVTHYALDVLTKEYEKKCWLLLKAGRGIKVSFEKDLLPATIKRGNRAAVDAGLVEGDVILEMNRRDVSNCSGDVILDYMWEFIHTDIELLVARFIHVDYPEPYQKDHYRVIVSSQPRYDCESSPLESDHGSPYDFALDESPCIMGRSTRRLEHGEKTPGKGAGKSIGKRISGAMTKISKQLFGRRRMRSKSQERGGGRSKSQDRGRLYDSGEHAGRSPRIPKRSGRAYGSCRSISASRDSGLYTEEEDKENLNDHVYVNLDSLVSRPLHIGRRPQSTALVSDLQGAEVNPVVLRSSMRSRHVKAIIPGSLSDGEQLNPTVASSSRSSRRLLNSTISDSALHTDQVKPADYASDLVSRCLLKSTASVSAVLRNEDVNATFLVSSMDHDIPKSFAAGSAPNGKEMTSGSNTNNKRMNSMDSSCALNSSKAKLTAADSALNSQCLRRIASGSTLNIEASNATDPNFRVSTESQQPMTIRPTLNSEQLKSTLASGTMLIDEPSSSTPNEKSLTSTVASRSELVRSHGSEGLGSFRLPSQSLKGNYFSPYCLTPNSTSSPDSFTGTGLTSKMEDLEQRSLINLNRSSFGAQNATSAPRPRDQRVSMKLDEPTKPVGEDSTFDCTFVSDIIQEDGGEEPMSWLSSFTDSPFSRLACNLDGELKKPDTCRFSS